MYSQYTYPNNRLLASLPATSLADLLPRLKRVELPLKKVLQQPEVDIESIYFVESGMISMVAVLHDGVQAEVGVIGREGFLGTSLLSGISTSYVECMVQMSGSAFSMTSSEFSKEIELDVVLRMHLLRYSEALQAQVMQTAACNGRHDLEPRLARWLLMAHDRSQGGALKLTQEFMAMMRGVSRPSISITAGILQRAGMISHSAGRVTILNRVGLESVACECYSTVRRRYAEILGVDSSSGSAQVRSPRGASR